MDWIVEILESGKTRLAISRNSDILASWLEIQLQMTPFFVAKFQIETVLSWMEYDFKNVTILVLELYGHEVDMYIFSLGEGLN